MEPVAWSAVCEVARTHGADDLARAVEALPDEDREAAWRRACEKPLPRILRRGKRRRHRYIEAVVQRWRLRPDMTGWTAAAIRRALSAPEPELRPPLEPGNRLAVVHGAGSEREIASRLPEAVERVRAAIAEEVVDRRPSDEVRLREVARTLVRCELLDAYLDHLGGSLLDQEGKPVPSAGLRLSLANLLQRQLDGLGLGPMARARLHADQAQGARDALAIQQRLREDYGRGA